MHVPWWGVLPFAMLLACIATFPLLPLTHKKWEHSNAFKLGVALFFGLPMGAWMWLGGESGSVVHALVEYAQFITLLLSLFVVSGGIFVSGDIRASPRNNTLFLGLGAVIASFIGTTGAAMLLIRPLLNTNKERVHKIHTVVFATFIVANCGGLLTPLGDPPLFLGMLRGVPFLWTMNLLPEWLFVNGLLLLGFYGLDRKLYAQEPATSLVADDTTVEPLGVKGKLNFLWLACIVGAVAAVPSVDLHAIGSGHAHWYSYVPGRELVMLTTIGLSYFLSSREVRFEQNKFTWGPILEVAALFIGIFLAMIPALKYLGQIAPTLPLNELTFFFFSGGLSSVLDNAPTYATFFEMASKLPGEPRIAGVPELYLTAVSQGSVFCGAMTYIGNGPNFMVKAVAESAGVKMPSFAGYTLKWAVRYLAPVLLGMVFRFVAQELWLRLLGGTLGLACAGLALWQAASNPDPHQKAAPKPAA